jgi:hypothetical protein
LRANDWIPPEPDALRPLHRSFAAYAQGLRALLDRDLSQHIDALADQRQRALTLLGTGRNAATIAKKLQVVDQAARDAGVSARTAAVQRSEVLAQFRQVDLRCLDALDDLDQRDELPLRERLTIAAGSDAASMHGGHGAQTDKVLSDLLTTLQDLNALLEEQS